MSKLFLLFLCIEGGLCVLAAIVRGARLSSCDCPVLMELRKLLRRRTPMFRLVTKSAAQKQQVQEIQTRAAVECIAPSIVVTTAMAPAHAEDYS
jgi:hypothetical protein